MVSSIKKVLFVMAVCLTMAQSVRAQEYPVIWEVEEVNSVTGLRTRTKLADGQLAVHLAADGITCSVDDEVVSITYVQRVGYKHSRSMYCQQKVPPPPPGLPKTSNHAKPFEKVTAECNDYELAGDYASATWPIPPPEMTEDQAADAARIGQKALPTPAVTVTISCTSRRPGR